MNKISIIIPILNEADIIGDLLQHLLDNSSKENIVDIIVVDGRSVDGSQELVSTFKNIELLNSKKGRSKQMNFGSMCTYTGQQKSKHHFLWKVEFSVRAIFTLIAEVVGSSGAPTPLSSKIKSGEGFA